MNARDKAKAAMLRKLPDELFAAEAARRGFTRRNGRAVLPAGEAERMVQRLQQAFYGLTNDGGDLLNAVRATRYVERELQTYLRIAKERATEEACAQ